ncbi:dephospho-CoA kinase [bacterium]|nr:dephospho-CoA kinase [bacterium]
MRQTKPVGLTGGIATGKSTVVEMFRELGAFTISSDNIAAEILVKGSDALNDLVREFGGKLLTSDGQLNRSEMLNILINQPGSMKRQLNILSPYILPAIDEIVAGLLTKPDSKLVLVEAPLLFEYENTERYYPIVVVTIPRKMQIERLMKRSGKSFHWAESVIDLQWSMKEKIKRANFVIRNDRNLENTRDQVESIYHSILRVLQISD